MAEVPRYSTQVTPRSGVPALQDVNVNANAFGAPISQALGQLSNTVGQVGDVMHANAIKMATLDAKAQVDNAVVDLDKTQNQQILDYKDKNLGINAVNNINSIYATLDQSREAGRSLMTSPLQRQLYDEATRLNQVKMQNGLAAWAADQRKQYNVQQFKALAENQARGATLENFDKVMAEAEPQFIALGTELGWSPAQREAEFAKFKGETIYGLVVGKAARDPNGAAAALTKYGEVLSPRERGVLENQIQSAQDNWNIANVADETYESSSTIAGITKEALVQSIIQQETGGRAGLVGPMTKYGQAEGLMQMLPSTAKATAQAAGIAWKPELMRDKTEAGRAYQEKLGRAHIDQLYAKYGNDPGLVASAYFGGTDQKIWGAKTQAYREQVLARALAASGLNGTDLAENNIESALAKIAADPRLRGDPILINRAQSQYRTNLSQAQYIQNQKRAEALNELTAGFQATGARSVKELLAAQPQLTSSWNALTPKAQLTFQNQLTAEGNRWDPVKQQTYLQAVGLATSDPQKFLALKPTELDIPMSAQTQLFKRQQAIITQNQKQLAVSNNVNKALSNVFIKNAVSRAGIKRGTPEFYGFTGTLEGVLETWSESNPGKKPTDADYSKMAAQVLADSGRVTVTRTFGIPTGREGIPMYKGALIDYDEDGKPDNPRARALYEAYMKKFGEAPSPDKLAYMYQRASR